jgi:hypothetical protein
MPCSTRMNRSRSMLPALAISSACIFSACAGPGVPEPLEGHWVGTLDAGNDLLFMRAKFSRTWAGLAGTLDLVGTGRLALAKSSYAASDVFFLMKLGEEVYAFTGDSNNGVMAGQLHRGDRQWDFKLRRVPELDPKLIRSYLGTYRVGTEWVRSIEDCVDHWGAHQMTYVDPKNGARKALFAISETSFFFGPGFLIPEPVEGTVTFLKGMDGRSYLVWNEYGWDVMVGQRVAEAAQPGPPLVRGACERCCYPKSG